MNSQGTTGHTDGQRAGTQRPTPATGPRANASKLKAPKKSQADRLVELARSAELFHTPGQDGDGYATVTIGDPPHRETWPIRSKRFGQWLSRRLYEQIKKAPCAQALANAMNVLCGRAMFDGPAHPVAVRVAECCGDYWLDLADESWRAVRITRVGWQVVSSCPVRFVRPAGMLALPEPVRGGHVDELREVVNVPDELAWTLIKAWLIAVFRPCGPYPVLCPFGEQGSAKTMLCRFVRDLVDPNVAGLRCEPREVRDLMIAASNGWIVAYDNMSHIQPWLSDAICRLATGGGFSTRELYTNGDEKLFDAQRPVLLNGIEELVTRPDLLDRTIPLMLPTIPDSNRRTERELKAAYEAARPRILGALLDAVVSAMNRLPSVHIPNPPRMADFAEWVVAAEPALGLQPGKFLTAYSGNRAGAHDLAIESSPFGLELLRFIENRTAWEGTAAELLADLNAIVDDRMQKARGWPRTPRGVSGNLRRLSPTLRTLGIAVSVSDRHGHSKKRIISLEKVGAEQAASAAEQATTGNVATDAATGAERCVSSPVEYDTAKNAHESPTLERAECAADSAGDFSEPQSFRVEPIDLDDLSDDRREAFEERAAILEFDAGLTRSEAEARAAVELSRFGAAENG